MNAEPMDVWLTRPKGRSLFISLLLHFLATHLLFPRSAGNRVVPVQLTMFSSSLPRRMAPATRQWVVSTTIQHLGALMVRHQTEAHTKDTPRSLAKKLRFHSDGNLMKYFFWREGERESKWSY